MTDSLPPTKPAKSKDVKAQAKAERLKAALRDNLKRRKEATRKEAG